MKLLIAYEPATVNFNSNNVGQHISPQTYFKHKTRSFSEF